MRAWPAAALLATLLAAAAHPAPLETWSADGHWRLVADGAALTVLDAAQRATKTFVGAAADGRGRSNVAAVFDAAPRRSFVVAFETLPEIWEISYDPGAEPIYQGLVHDYRQGEGVAEPGFLNPRRTRLEAPMRWLAFDPSRGFMLGRTPASTSGPVVLQLVQLDVRRRIAEFALPSDTEAMAARRTQRNGHEVFEVLDNHSRVTLVVDLRTLRAAAASQQE